MKLKYKLEISTNLWIPLSSHIYFDRSKLWHTPFMMAPKGLPFLWFYEKGKIRTLEQKGYDWPLLKGRAGGEVGTRMSGMLPDTG